MSIGSALLQLLYPDDVVCPACGMEARLNSDRLCESCREALVRAPADIRCPAELDGLAAGLRYNEAIEPAMHWFKYQRQVWLAPFFASYMEIPSEWAADCLVPVPLHPLREWQRTYNQSELLCRALSERDGIPVRTDLIRRTRYTRQQAKLSAEMRHVNLKGAFKVNPRAAELSIVLIDDVTTTHSTLLACAIAMRHAGASRVYAATACIAGHDLTQ